MPRGRALSPDGKRIVLGTGDGIAWVSVEGGEPQMVRGSQPGELPVHWAKDGQSLFVGVRGDTACVVSRLNVETGARTPWKTFGASDVAGIIGVSCPSIAADEEHYVIGYTRSLSDLFLVDHLK